MGAGEKCRECGAAVPADSPGGFCAQCLLGLGLKEGQLEDGGPHAGAQESEVSEQGAENGGRNRENKTQSTGTTPAIERSGDEIGRFQLLEELGHGGCGIVYLAEQQKPVRRRVALKVIKLGMDTRQVVARFEAERQALALMDHPNIARVFDAGTTELGRPYFVMELVSGLKITEYCDQHQLTTAQRLDLFVQVCRAIQHAHQKGIIHRDIKPSNVLVATPDGVPVPKVIDFGIAKATQGRLTDQTIFTAFEQFIGTPAYMSPEQAQLGGVDVDTRSDIYSLGVLLYELLTGMTPFDTREMLARGFDEMRRTIQEKEPVTPSTRLKQETTARPALSAKTEIRNPKSEIDKDLDWIVMKCLEKDRGRRYETANGLARDIERHLSHEPVVARPPSRWYTLQKLVRKNKLVWTASAAVVAALLVGIIGIFSQWRRAEQHATRERNERSLAQSTLTQMEAIEVRRAEEYYEGGDRRKMLSHLALVLRQNPSNHIAAERLFSTLSHRNWARLACPPLMHSNRVTFALFSTDGTRVVTSSADNTAWVWDAATGQRLAGPFSHEAEINTAVLSEDGRFVITASKDKTARVWNVASGILVTPPLQHSDDVLIAFFTPAGNQVFTVSGNQGQLWSVDSGQRVGDALQCADKVLDVRPSPDGSCVAMGCLGGEAAICDVKSNKFRHRLRHNNNVGYVAFSPDGRRLLTGSNDNTARIWDVETGQAIGEPLQHSAPVRGAEFSADGQRVVTASSDHTGQVWDAGTGHKIGIPLQHNSDVRFAMFSPEGLRVSTAASDSTARVWDAETGEPLTEPLSLESGGFLAQFHNDGQRILTASNGKAVLVWQIVGTPALTLHFSVPIIDLEFGPDRNKIILTSDASNTRLWDPLTAQPLTPPLIHSPGSWVIHAVFSPDGKLVATASDDGLARVWNASNGQLLAGPMAHNADVTALVFSPDGTRLLTTSTYVATVWNAQTGARLLEVKQDAKLSLPAQFSPDGRKLLTTTETGVARVYDGRTGEAVTPLLSHAAKITSAEFSPDGRFLLTAAGDPSFFIWDLSTGRRLERRWQHRDLVLSAVYSRDGKRVLTATLYYGVQVWDLNTGVSLTGEVGRRAKTASAVFGPKENTILISSYDNKTELLDSSSGQRVSEILSYGKGGGCGRRLSPDERLMVNYENSYVAIWEVPSPSLPVPQWLPELAEALAGQRFNQQGVLEAVSPPELWEVQQKMVAWGREQKGQFSSSKQQSGLDVHKPVTGEARMFYSRWVNWFLGSGSSRTVLPSSPLTLAEQAQSFAEKADNLVATREALLLQPTNVAAMAAFALLTTNTFQADWLSDSAMKQEPIGLPKTLWARESILRRSGRFEEAIALLDQRASLWADNPWIWGNRGESFANLGRLDEALDQYRNAVSLARMISSEAPAYDRDMRRLLLHNLLVDRWRLLKRLNRHAEAQKDFLEAKHILPRADVIAPSVFFPVDLRLYLNEPLETYGLTRVMGATNLVAPLPVLHGVGFELSGCVRLVAGATDPVTPSRVEGIHWGQVCRAFHFLHTCGVKCEDDTPFGFYVIHYAGGTQEEIPIVYGQNVRGWWDMKGLQAGATEAWSGVNDHGHHIRLIKFSWQNPHPDTAVQTIDFIAKRPDAQPILLAITAEQ